MEKVLVVMVAAWVVGGLSSCGEATAVTSERDEAPQFIEPDTGVTVVDSDVLDEGGGYDGDLASTNQALTVALTADGNDDVWHGAAKQHLTYCVDADSFGDATAAVEAAMEKATADWERSANVHFTEVAAENGRCSRTNSKVVFDVRGVSGRPYLARSFFPSSARNRRELLVDATALPPPRPLTLPGVLRHELGHILGLRHEHTRLRSNPCYEDGNWRAVTSYDQRSVMHYPQCAGIGGHDLVLTTKDQAGIGALYP